MALLGFLILIFSPSIALASVVQEDAYYRHSPTGTTFIGSFLQSVPKRSKLDCMILCSQTADCRGVSVCPGNTSRYLDCTLLSGQNSSVWNNLEEVIDISCFFALKKCQNGGQPEGKKCKCQNCFLGDYCEVFPRDCCEWYDTRQPDNSFILCYIHPITAPAPFLAYCYVYQTTLLQRYNESFTKLDWSSAKKGQYQDEENFFVGLENMYYIVKQAMYSLAVIAYNGDYSVMFGYEYTNFTLAGEDEDYALRFSSHYPDGGNQLVANMFNGTPPIVFCSATRDPGGCAARRGSPGWYGSDCNGYSMFVDPLLLPFDGTEMQFQVFYMTLIRHGDFYYGNKINRSGTFHYC